MRQIININDAWGFSKEISEVPSTYPMGIEVVNLPHTWNATDGQDGGNDYYRGTCYYVKELKKSSLPEAALYYLEFEGANSSADVYVNGEKVAHHDGGYSTWRVNVTPYLKEENVIAVAVDNAPNDRVYPQTADFTFYGGLYRNVNIIAAPETHFDLDYYGAPGIAVTPELNGNDAVVEIVAYVTDMKAGQKLYYKIFDKEGALVAEALCEDKSAKLEIKDVIRWHGRKNPYLYTAEVSIIDGESVVDAVKARFGCRTFEIDPERGFILNGEEYPLRGVSRHQDRLGIGNALLPEHHKEDVELIMEVGATTIRLAHYQHAQYFYDLCDEYGLVLWAEIPYISNHMSTGRENTISQMKELVYQNYNHPSIVVWGLSNEITMAGAKDPDLLENHRILNDLVHSIDKTRLTTVACVSMCNMDEEYVHISDVVSYNHYFGWYGGDTSMNGPWFDKFHEKYPNKPIGVSEYGCEALNWHTSKPTQGDYTEEYQAYYHEELIKQLFTRKYLWATHVWNMFDFAADARAEGGENGQNHKGLMTFDRKYKKDAFYAYKAWLSDEPFVHIAGKRYVNREDDVTKVTVYSNLPEVELFVNGESIGKKSAPDHFFYFDVKNVGTSEIKAVAGEYTKNVGTSEIKSVAGEYTDTATINKVDEPDPAYKLQEVGAILNWFDITEPEGRLSVNSKLSEIMKTIRGKIIVGLLMAKVVKGMKKGKGEGGGFNVEKDAMMQMLGGFTLLRLTNLVGMMNVKFTKEELLRANKWLNKIKIKK